jgi:hypothetical protein
MWAYRPFIWKGIAMFQVMPGKGFALELQDGSRIEVDFGPMSRSENINISKEAFAAGGGKSGTAEIRHFKKGDTRLASFVRNNATVDDFISIVSGNVTSE